MDNPVRFAFVAEKEDMAKLQQEARKLGLTSISSLVRMIIKDFLTKKAAESNKNN